MGLVPPLPLAIKSSGDPSRLSRAFDEWRMCCPWDHLLATSKQTHRDDTNPLQNCEHKHRRVSCAFLEFYFYLPYLTFLPATLPLMTAYVALPLLGKEILATSARAYDKRQVIEGREGVRKTEERGL
jgi:hypothetical protein